MDAGPEEQVWDAVVDGWDRHHHQLAEHSRPVTQRMLELMAARPREVVLELAGGIGDLSRALAAQVGRDGRVIYSDLSPRMVEAARTRSHGLDNVACQVLDAQRMGLGSATVDGIVCKMGLMLLPDPASAAVECRRVLRQGGRLVVATWGAIERNLWITTFAAAMLTHGHALDGDPSAPGGLFSVSTASALNELLTGAGFDNVEVETVAAPERHSSFDDYWQLRADTSGPLAVALRRLDPDKRTAIRQTCQDYAETLLQPDGAYEFPQEALVARAQ